MSTATGPALHPLCAVQFGDYVTGLAWRPDGGLIGVACADGAVHELLPDAGASAPVGEHAGGACAIGFAPDGTMASAGSDGRVAIGVLPPRPAGAGWIELLAWSAGGEAGGEAAGRDRWGRLATAVGRRVQLWTPTGELVAESPQLPATVECLAWEPGGAGRLAAGGHGGVSFLSPDGALVGTRLEWTGVVLALAWAPDGRRLACGMQDQAVWVWDVAAERASTLGGYARKVRELSWSFDGLALATGGGSVPVVWRFPPGAVDAFDQAELRGHRSAVTCVAFQPSGMLLASSSEDGLGILWLPPHERPLVGATLEEPVVACAWSPDGTRLALGGETGRVAVFALTP